jgi:Arc/MetJ-type ribon-helix-helix transcriptional regulator
MDIRPSPNQEALIRQAVEAGRFKHPEDAVMEALALWEERERARRIQGNARRRGSLACTGRGHRNHARIHARAYRRHHGAHRRSDCGGAKSGPLNGIPPRQTRRGGPGRHRLLHRQGKRQPRNRQACHRIHHGPISPAWGQSLRRPSSRRRSGPRPQKLFRPTDISSSTASPGGTCLSCAWHTAAGTSN